MSRSWNRYFYDVEANTIAVEKVRYEEVDSEQIYEVIDPVDNVLLDAVNRGEIITQGSISVITNYGR